MGKFGIKKNLRAKNLNSQIIKDETLMLLEERFEVKEGTSSENLLLKSLSGGKLSNVKGTLKINERGDTFQVSFDGEHKINGASWAILIAGAFLTVVGGLGLIVFLIQMFMFRKSNKETETAIREAFNDITLNLNNID
ncbi:hypothetical protein L2D08_04350 [Domibacillus sp. PGB-M46]|uniref:hypothetical protein n=1 Tax=Domibacillus sp. PGB-M46 TaxID=2910255 RepID=UPI001F5A4FAA|nr:hypothetical protein [Domibacillus sp. PGB-M46]MCI2253589.1 hypothetical protein [Domibacillus sp. PGB-M46]